MFDIKEIHSVTDFQRNAKTHLKRIRKSKTPLILTLNGKAQAVIQDADAYQDLLVRLGNLEEEFNIDSALRLGFQDKKNGRVRPAVTSLKKEGRKLGLLQG